MGTEIWCLLVVILLLFAVVIHQQLFFSKQIQSLVDKLMSRSYAEYQAVKEPPPPKVVQVQHDVPEDLRALQEFNMGI